MKDKTARQITKIAREVSKFTTRTLKTEGIGRPNWISSMSCGRIRNYRRRPQCAGH
ncbi:MAG: hypothetical protein ACLSA6_10880 [Holdemania massiliensis]